MVYTKYMVYYKPYTWYIKTLYMVYYKPYTWYIIYPIHGILYILLKIGIKNWPKTKTD